MDSSTGDVLAVGTVTAVDADLSTITISSASSQMFDTSTNLSKLTQNILTLKCKLKTVLLTYM
jgi:hypothetical protein